ncbi:choice-of-anchor D domain-containing protein, partial [Myxococcota bacterium]|nr:choice-of-anchor D domain-containing protein [Myxococcota bacterium]
EIIKVTNNGLGQVPLIVELSNDGIPEVRPGDLPGMRGVFFLGEYGCAVVGPGETVEIPVEYRPSTAGEHHGEVTLMGLGTAVKIPLLGKVIGAHICFRTEDDVPDDSLLAFGDAPDYDVPSNDMETRRIFVGNCGYEENLDITLVEMTAQSSTDFSGPTWTTQSALVPGDEVELPVTFTPTGSGGMVKVGRYMFTSNDRLRGTAAVDLSALIGAPEQCVLVGSPATVEFGWVAADEEGMGCDASQPFCPGVAGEVMISRAMELTLLNVGERDCSNIQIADIITDSNSTDMFEITSNANVAGFTLTPGAASLPITIVFAREPSENALDHNGKLPISSDDFTVAVTGPSCPEGSHCINLEARGGGSPTCALAFAPVSSGGIFCTGDTLAFGNVNIGQEKSVDLKIANVGSEVCNVSNLRGSNSVFSFSNTPFDIPVNQFVILPVTFRPIPPSGDDPFAEIPFLCGDNKITMSANTGTGGLSNEDHTVNFTGKGTRPDIDVIPGQVDFGEVTVGCCSRDVRVAIYNSGDGTLLIQSAAGDTTPPVHIHPNSDPGFSNTMPADLELTPGENTEFTVRFCASAEGVHTGSVEIISTDDNEEYFTVPLTGTGTLDNLGHDDFQQPERPKVDVLWSVDDSGSMSDEQDNLANNFGSFIDTALSLDTDYHIGVVMTEVESDEAGHLYACSGNPLWISDLQSASVQRTQFRCNVKTSDSDRPHSDSKEAALQAARMTLDYPNVDGFNAGFYREDATLYVILVTDEADQSDGTAQLYVDYFQNLKGLGNPDLLNISAITGPPPDGCDTAEANDKGYEAVNLVGGQFRSICTADWSDLVASLGLDVFNARAQFPLSRPATPDSISVQVCDDDGAGNPVNCHSETNWSFNTDVNAITFDDGHVPGASDHIIVDFEAVCY